MYYREGPVRFSEIMPLTKRLKHIFSNPALIMGLSLGCLCLVIAVLLLSNFPQRSSESRTIEGLASPRGLSPLGDGSLLIAEGGAGRILLVDRRGNVTVLQDNLPHTQHGPEGVHVGVSAAIKLETSIYFIVGEARAKGFREVYEVVPGSIPIPLTGQDPLGVNPPNPLTNPYDLLPAATGGLLISDSGANAVWHVSPTGKISLYAEIEPISVISDEGQTQIQAVPTGLAFGPDGAVYVATLTGFPFPVGGSSVIKLQDNNNDGDALDDGESIVYADGFTAATDVAFESSGSMLVTEYSQNMQGLAEIGFEESGRYGGRLVRWHDGNLTVIASGLVSPTAVAVMSGRIYVSEEFAGRVRIIKQ